MSKPSTTLHIRIQVRAYYISLATGACALDAWLEAEAIEIALAAKRKASAVKAAVTRKAKAAQWDAACARFAQRVAERKAAATH